VAIITGSSAMISEGIHSVIDCISQILLIWGIRISKKQPDEKRPFGYGRELYFWSFMVSLIMFSLGGCIALYEGVIRFRRLAHIENPGWNYLVLAVAAVFTAISAMASLKAFNKQQGDIPFWQAVTQSKDPTVFIVLLGDFGDLLGIIVAFLGIYIGHRLHDPHYDGIASMLIGVILIGISMILLRESRSLLMGETLSRKALKLIIALTEADESVVKVKKHFSTYLAPEEIVLQMITVFKDNMTTQQITEAIDRIIKKIQQKFPRVKQIFIEPGR